jgi:transcriptional regulator with XRE-family HTH domain
MTKEELKKWRSAKKLTQSHAAKLLFISIQQYQKWEYGFVDVPEIVSSYIKLLDMVRSKHSFVELSAVCSKMINSVRQRIPADPARYVQIKADYLHSIRGICK